MFSAQAAVFEKAKLLYSKMQSSDGAAFQNMAN
jgi:hypothetical protein